MRTLAASIVILLPVVLSAGCGLPLAHKHYDQIVAVGWDSENRPIALAQDVHLYKRVYPLHPEGPGVYKSFRRGAIVLLMNSGKRIPLTPEISSQVDINVVNAVSRAPEPSFLFVATATTSDIDRTVSMLCLVIDDSGTTRPCHLPVGTVLHDYGLYLPPGGHQIWLRRVHDKNTWFEAVDIDTGTVSRLDDDRLTVGLRSANEAYARSAPCDMSYGSFSAAARTWAVVCRLAANSTGVLERTG